MFIESLYRNWHSFYSSCFLSPFVTLHDSLSRSHSPPYFWRILMKFRDALNFSTGMVFVIMSCFLQQSTYHPHITTNILDHYSAWNRHNCHTHLVVSGFDHLRVKPFVLLPGRLLNSIDDFLRRHTLFSWSSWIYPSSCFMYIFPPSHCVETLFWHLTAPTLNQTELLSSIISD